MTDTVEPDQGPSSQDSSAGDPLDVVLLHQHQGPEDDRVAAVLHEHLTQAGHRVAVDRSQTGRPDWAARVEAMIQDADVVMPLISKASAFDEVLGFEVEVANEAQRQRQGRPVLLPVRVGFTGRLPEPMAAILEAVPYQLWEGEYTEEGLLAEVDEVLAHLPVATRRIRRPGPSPLIEQRPEFPLEPVGGAVPLTSKFYIHRPADQQLLQAVERLDSIVLIKGARQMGKTSLLARGLDAARQRGARVTLTDFQGFGFSNLETPSTVYLSLAESLVDQLELDVQPQELWDPRRSANVNFTRFLRREVLGKLDGALVWGLDEVDRLLVTDYASEVFGLFRSWHNDRALDPAGPWSRLSLLIGYATEPHLFISDPNQSPFNVGTRLGIDDFTREQVGELNERHGRPLSGREELDRFMRLVGGHPYLVRRGLHEIASHNLDIAVFEARAATDEGIYGDHLRRILMVLALNPELTEMVRDCLLGREPANPLAMDSAFFRLRSAGVMAGSTPDDMRPRCQLYATYLKRHLL